MNIARETLTEYQIRRCDCRNRYTLADRLLNKHGYQTAVKICQENHWAGVKEIVDAIQSM